MKKFLLSLAVLCGLSSAANAEVYSISCNTQNWEKSTYTLGDKTKEALSGNLVASDGTIFKAVIKQNTSSTSVDGINGSTDMIKWYKSMYLSIEAPEGMFMSEIKFVASAAKYCLAFEPTTDTAGEVALDNANLTMTWTATAPVAVFEALANNGQMRITKIEIKASSSASAKKSAELAFDNTDFTVEFGKEFVAPKLTKATTAAVEYASSNEDVATVNEVNGTVEIVGLGTTTITATAAENDEFYGGSASYTINVVSLVNVAKATAMSAGEFVLVADGKYNGLFDKNYGYMSTESLPESYTEASFRANAAFMLTFLEVEGGYNIATSTGRFLGAKDGYKTFDTTADSEANRVWTVEIAADGLATITNVATGKVVYQD
ncbi:MAG: Ig-like domain-containing protein, partial [Muribaculaceae bacterium]|nr:Ig-like domain-containing protein [Muribaculaceae bacterium]